MASLERYRLFLKKGGYDVSVGRSRFEALDYYVEKGGRLSDVKSIVMIKGSGNQKIFKVNPNG